MPNFADSDIINYAVRMVVPMRREFGRKLDVQQFMHDSGYAREVLDEALTSKDARLLEYASYVAQRLMSARIAAGPGPLGRAAASAATSTAAASTAPDTQPGEPGHGDDKALRNRVLRKYTGGLR